MSESSGPFSRIRAGRAPFIVAEIGSAQDGRPDTLSIRIDAAAHAGADAVACHIDMPAQEWSGLVGKARQRGMYVLADVSGPAGAQSLGQLGADGFCIHASDILNAPLQQQVAALGRTMWLSCAGARQLEILDAINRLKSSGNEQIILVHGFDGAATCEDANLRRITALTSQFGLPVGYAHYATDDAGCAGALPLMACAAGATIVVTRVTSDPARLSSLVRRVREGWKAIGAHAYDIGHAEATYRADVRKVLVAGCDLPRGTRIDEGMLAWMRVETTAHSLTVSEAVRRTLSADVRRGEVLTLDRLDAKVIALISCRLGSKRLPGKVLLPLAGRPAIEHLIDRVVRARRVHRVVLCTSVAPENDALEAVARATGIGCFRGSEDDVLERFVGAATEEGADVVVRVTGDDLLTDPRMLDAAVEYHLAQNADYTSYPGLPKGMETEIISAAALRRAHELAESREFAEYLTYFVLRPDIFRVSTMPVDPDVQRPYCLTLDTSDDYRRLEKVFERLYRPGEVFSSEEVIDLLDRCPDLCSIAAPASTAAAAINARLRIAI